MIYRLNDLPIASILLHSLDFLLRYLKGFLKCIVDLLSGWVVFAEIVVADMLLHLVFDVER